MQVVPVIDIRDGVVARAVAGRRAEYAPLQTPLAPSSAPLDVARGLMSLHPFRAFYIADLDAIEGRGDNFAAIYKIGEAFPALRLWVDAGFKDYADATSWLHAKKIDAVLGSESFEDLSSLALLRSHPRAILSLDFLGERFLGHPGLRAFDAMWPQRVVVMTLARVGERAGPDLARVSECVARAKGRRVYAAGGVRSVDDLLALKAAGAAGALVATALHDGGLTRGDLARLSQK